MKTIKFRGINDDGTLVYPDKRLFGFGGLKSYDILQRFSNVEQFTGLQDSKGKDIYEGDIIKSKSSIGTYTIVWDNCGFKKRGNIDAKSAFNYKNDGIFDIFIYDGDNEEKKDYYEIEVIGNIHENKNLFK